MTDLKPYYDNVLKAQANVQAVINQIDALMVLGTDEGNAQAQALEPQLDEATAQAEKAQTFYDKLKHASATSNVVKNFVPITAEEISDDEEEPKGIMKRSDFENMVPRERMNFIRGGGTIED